MDIIPIKISVKLNNKQQIKRSWEFAKKVVPTTNYSDHFQFDNNKKRRDAFYGKLGEVAVSNQYKQIGIDITDPDFTIYQPHEKSWDHDLYIYNQGIGVKTAYYKIKNHFSWVYSTDKNGRLDNGVLDPDSLHIFVIIHNNSKFDRIATIYPIYRRKQLKFYRTFKNFEDKKLAVFECMLPCNINNPFFFRNNLTEEIDIEVFFGSLIPRF